MFLNLVNDLLRINCTVFFIFVYLDTLMENKTNMCEWALIPFNASQCCLGYTFQLALSPSHANQKRAEISRGFRAPELHKQTVLSQTISMKKKPQKLHMFDTFSSLFSFIKQVDVVISRRTGTSKLILPLINNSYKLLIINGLMM